MEDNEKMKKCNSCSKREGKLVEKPLSEFFKDKNGKYGLSSSCRDCRNQYMRTRAQIIRHKLLAWRKTYYRSRIEKLKVSSTSLPSVQEKRCIGCSKIEGRIVTKPIKEFCKNSQNIDGYHSYCRKCSTMNAGKYKRSHAGHVNAMNAGRRASKLQATPSWLTEDQKREIKFIYEVAAAITRVTGIPHEVDHIIPLKGKQKINGHVIEVSGLHAPWNLRVITESDNCSKNNRFLGDI